MKNYFTIKPTREIFPLFSTEHFAILGCSFIFIVLLFVTKDYWREQKRNKVSRWLLFCLLFITDTSYYVWKIVHHDFDLTYDLPFHLCSLSYFLCLYMLATKSYRAFEIAYFTGVGGAILAIITPVINYDFPHFRYIEYFLYHFLLILIPLYMVAVHKYRPTINSIWRTFLFLNGTMVVVFFINKLIGANYLFLVHKPKGDTLLNYLGPHPWYIASLEGIVFIVFFVLYLPFIVKKLFSNSEKFHSIKKEA